MAEWLSGLRHPWYQRGFDCGQKDLGLNPGLDISFCKEFVSTKCKAYEIRLKHCTTALQLPIQIITACEWNKASLAPSAVFSGVGLVSVIVQHSYRLKLFLRPGDLLVFVYFHS